ncbi:MAG TPA: transcriptional regulator GcvA [Alphaproteobacteria bacterium]|nr:transcriptional regulator GcvA [Alphaproteobacteria bacterium]
MRRLPSLNGLRAFEAAARHASFTAAAAELNVTQAAVSRLVRLLEARLGVALFERRPNALVLTPQGAAYAPGLTQAFDSIARLTEQVQALRPAPILTLATGPSFAMRWLIPRLADFGRRHPDVEVRITTAPGGWTVFRDDWTAAIRHGAGDWPGFVAHPLFRPDIVPVCTPAVAARLRRPADLRGETLLQVAHAPEDWPLWLEAAGLPDIDPGHGPRFDYYALALQAALDGIGIAISLTPYVVDDLAAGRLVAPFDLRVPKGTGWHLIHRPGGGGAALAAFRAWLLAQVREGGASHAEIARDGAGATR